VNQHSAAVSVSAGAQKGEWRWVIARPSVPELREALHLEPEANLGANWAAVAHLLAPASAGDLSNPSSAIVFPPASVWARFLMLAIHWRRSNSHLLRTFSPPVLPLSPSALSCR